MILTNLPERTNGIRLPFLSGVCFLSMLLLISGCKNSSPPPAKKTNSKNSPQKTSSKQADTDCDSFIDNSINMLEPARLGISADLEQSVGLLNDWAFKCGGFDANPPVVTDSQKPFLKKYLSEAQLAKMDLIRFTTLDGRFIRDAQLANGMMKAAIKGQTSDLNRLTAAFYYCMNNIALIANENNEMPLSPYEICILGAGSPEQRAWVYINVLRQMHIDAVLFRPAVPSRFKLLVGVLIDQNIYLYDPVLGLPVPAAEQPADSILIQNPATLDSVLKTPDLLKNFYGKAAENRFSAAELKTAQVLIMGRSSEWSARMRLLEDSLSRKQTFVLFRNLDAFEGDPGFIAHIQTIGKGILKDSTIKVSEFPDQQITEREKMSGEKLKALTTLKLAFRAPVPYDRNAVIEKPDGTFDVKWGPPTRKLLKTRTEQLMGDQKAAIGSYITTRLEARFPSDLNVTQEVRLMHLIAAQQAAYFLALGKYLQGEDASASKSLGDYIRLYGRVDPERTLSAIYLMAISDAKAGKLSSAILAVAETKVPEALQPALPYLEKRWREIREKSKQK
ncbi:MAG: hypothetical protein K0U86_10480 [Planctomycetes bacterium]|nr:hypothetical protein [Planctomycetota bacterium]MCH9725317.1 hypothetical protein [Planctomycetota bacterium]MCH9779463.1 hypothetical protein [Planctomycetota bacterium]